jgi:hypothetical protein
MHQSVRETITTTSIAGRAHRKKRVSSTPLKLCVIPGDPGQCWGMHLITMHTCHNRDEAPDNHACRQVQGRPSNVVEQHVPGMFSATCTHALYQGRYVRRDLHDDVPNIENTEWLLVRASKGRMAHIPEHSLIVIVRELEILLETPKTSGSVATSDTSPEGVLKRTYDALLRSICPVSALVCRGPYE